MISDISTDHENILRANGKASPVGPEYSENIRVAIWSFCEAESIFPFVKQELTQYIDTEDQDIYIFGRVTFSCVPCLGADVIINSPPKDSTRSRIPSMPILSLTYW
jgi:hypothetical protein